MAEARRGWLRAAALGLLLLAGAASGFLAYRVLWRPAPAPLSAPAAAAPSSPSDQPEHRAVPAQLPDAHLHTLSGQSKSIRDYQGQPLIVNFWATWCAPCRREIPLLQALRHEHAAQKLEVLGIAVDFHEAVASFLAHTPIDYPLLIGEQDGLDAAEQFGMDLVLPFSVFADAGGQIIAVKVGELHREEADAILAAMDDLTARRTTLPAARARIAARLRDLAVLRARATAVDPPNAAR